MKSNKPNFKVRSVLCACGCGITTKVLPYRIKLKRSMNRVFISGHNGRNIKRSKDVIEKIRVSNIKAKANIKGKTNEQIYGKDKAQCMWNKKSKKIKMSWKDPEVRKRRIKGLNAIDRTTKVWVDRNKNISTTMVEVWANRSAKCKGIISEKTAVKKRGVPTNKRGKTYEQIYGDDKAKKLKIKLTIAHFGQKPVYPRPWIVSGLNHKVRSTWEEKVGLILKHYGIVYAYEKPFLLIHPDGTKHTYYADFTLLDEKIVIEPHAYLNKRDEIKFPLFREQYPDYKFIIISSDIDLKDYCDELILLEDFEKFVKNNNLASYGKTY